MKHIKETIIVEGRYDINTLKQCIDANVIETRGFGIFKDAEKRALIEKLAEKTGIIVLTDSDGAGFLIRNHLKGTIKNGTVKHAYIPEIKGRERRKSADSKSGLLGVEGMDKETITDALRRAGATFEDEPAKTSAGITKADMFELGLSGTANSAEKREKLAEKLGLPHLMSANAFLGAVNLLFSREEFFKETEQI